MTKVTCDKCGKQVSKFPWQAVTYPNYMITVVRNVGDAIETVDLCQACVKLFERWLLRKEEGND